MFNSRVFLALLAFIAIAASMYSPPREIQVGVILPLVSGTGSPLDRGPWGRTLLVEMLSRLGYRVELRLDDVVAKKGETIVVMLLGPTNCEDEAIPAWIRDASARGARVVVVASVEWSCRLVNESIAAVGGQPVILGGFINATIAASTPSGVISALYTAVETSEQPRAPGYLIDVITGSVIGIKGENFMFITDSHLFTNVLLELDEARQDKLLRDILNAFDAKPENTVVVVPIDAYRPRGAPALSVILLVHPVTLLIAFTSLLAELDSLVSSLGVAPWMVWGVAAALPLYLLLRR